MNDERSMGKTMLIAIGQFFFAIGIIFAPVDGHVFLYPLGILFVIVPIGLMLLMGLSVIFENIDRWCDKINLTIVLGSWFSLLIPMLSAALKVSNG